MNVTTRKMILADCQHVAPLLQKNSQSNHGGLFGEYPLKKVEGMFRTSLTTVIAQVGEQIAGVVFSFSVDSDGLPPVAKKIVELYPNLTRDDWFYGPVCIGEDFRGQGLLAKLCDKICSLNSGKAIAFINSDNIISLKAHEKIGFTEAGRFKLDDVDWFVLVRDDQFTE
ncbi:GNAT family N-acetyltransferase [Bartonella sp. HY329]|uniref:GNAT family N-acetyltransferase n=1 Tax=unclassified Bartonella TaxID=2645622 RepID=UPI0021C98213|nr:MULTISPECIES: GNAT family protein [unclassified Bartonella]UXM94811.1 GNAT family N-acetyltransferase [Bartonella sp. HY329]UXN09134.1 GNAT family N-acetyltransferase [Bartonella sp. HY328]